MEFYFQCAVLCSDYFSLPRKFILVIRGFFVVVYFTFISRITWQEQENEATGLSVMRCYAAKSMKKASSRIFICDRIDSNELRR